MKQEILNGSSDESYKNSKSNVNYIGSKEFSNSKPWEELTIDELFAKTVTEYRDKIAVIHGDIELSYGKLDELSNHLASFLYINGVKCNSSVGVHFNKGYLYLVSCIAILKCGASYIHIDSTYSNKLIERIVDENTPSAILTTTGLINKGIIKNTPVYQLNSFNEWQNTTLVNLDKINKKSNPSQTAIIGYTSGTTGNPKGVDVPHQAAVYSFSKFWQEVKDIPYDKKDRFAYVTYLAWDALSPLLFGSTGIIVPDDVTENIDLLFTELYENKVNHVFLTPTLLKKILDFISQQTIHNEKYQKVLDNMGVVWIGGETIDSTTVERFMNTFINSVLINNYGPTECWVVSQGRLLRSKMKDYIDKGVPNGEILSEIGYRILNDDGKDIGPGQIGYLYVSGPALANKYINNTDLTAKKFITLDDNQVYFQTGDLCKILDDGGLQIIGREDFLSSENSILLPTEKIEKNIKKIDGIIDCVVISSKKSLIEEDLLIFYVLDVKNNINNNILENNIRLAISEYGKSFISISIDQIPMNETSQKINYGLLLTLANKSSILEIL